MFDVPANPAQVETLVKKSRFISTAKYAEDRSAALRAVEESRQQFPDAGHHCWAYLLGSPKNPATVAMSDDGEPGGTAGKPILNVLQHKDVGNVVLVVSRYFGGIKLGAGGLVRAYSAAAQSAMEALSLTQYISKTQIRLTIAFSQEQDLRHWLSSHHGSVLTTEYSDGVACLVEIADSKRDLLLETALERGWTVAAE